MSDQYIKHLADMVRDINLKEVSDRTESTRDDMDKSKWWTSRGAVSVNGPKFMNWKPGVGGGGAIDLVMHLKGYDFKGAVSWLSNFFLCTDNHACFERKTFLKHSFQPPQRADNRLHRIKHYLHKKRCIPSDMIEALIKSGYIYADIRDNAVFLMLGKDKNIVGAELRGTGRLQWRGMAPGSRKKLGGFIVNKCKSKNIVLCESAIDAISYFVLHPCCITVSTSGAYFDPPWLRNTLFKGYKVYCGFDADEAGDYFAEKMIKQYPSVKRIRPAFKDWNEVLQMKFN